jgi:hypothetical protein
VSAPRPISDQDFPARHHAAMPPGCAPRRRRLPSNRTDVQISASRDALLRCADGFQAHVPCPVATATRGRGKSGRPIPAVAQSGIAAHAKNGVLVHAPLRGMVET